MTCNERCDFLAGLVSTAIAAESVAGVTGVTARLNPSKEGVEIRFPAKPDAAVLARLKASGWRWSKFSKCWYARDTARARQLAEEIAEAKIDRRAYEGYCEECSPEWRGL